jgi:hypothetical protein
MAAVIYLDGGHIAPGNNFTYKSKGTVPLVSSSERNMTDSVVSLKTY